MDCRFVSPLEDLIMKRCCMLFPARDVNNVNSNLKLCFETVRKLRPSDSMKVLKTWCNGWATSTRLHASHACPCLFGCSARPDDLRHYVQCRHLNSICKYLWVDHSIDPLITFGFLEPTVQRYKHLCCIFSGYHAMRRHAACDEAMQDVESLQSSQMRTLWAVFAEAYRAEARELSLQSRHFLVHEFVSFLINHM